LSGWEPSTSSALLYLTIFLTAPPVKNAPLRRIPARTTSVGLGTFDLFRTSLSYYLPHCTACEERAVEENPRQNDFCRAGNLRPLPHFSILLSSSLHHLLRTSR